MKRIIDIASSLIATLLSLPVMALIALVIATERNGPVIFRQERIGMNKKRFTMYKFRTMYHRSPLEIEQPKEGVVSTGKDNRITPIGRLLRATSLDELPQLFNVLNGTMSLVGPRPVLPEQMLAIPWRFMCRFNLRPGITGWAQVNGRRGLDWMKQLELDTWYAKNQNFRLDIGILLKTIQVVFCGSGIYGSAKNNWRSYLPR
jgi:lipopolysaccharide/colanic/teichoic acid biosynthesis glycosyltransferase